MTVKTKPVISIMVANWNGGEFLRRCLSSLQISARCSGLPFEIIVVDDNSSDESVAMVQSAFPNVQLITNNSNLGFARTVNKGAEAARGKILVLANNDIVAREEFIPNLVRWFMPNGPTCPASIASKPLFGVSAKTVGWYDGKANQLCMGAVWKGGRVTPAYTDPETASPCLFVQAGAAAYNLKMFRKLGGLSMLYEPGYWEDYDLSWRAARRGWGQLYDPKAFALHVGGGSMTKRFGADGVAMMKARNHLIFEAANLRSPRLLTEWAARLPFNAARDIATENRLYLRGLKGLFPRLNAALKQRIETKGAMKDEQILEPYKGFTASF
jgi:GT2 family glycosyltransferase